MPKSNPSRRYFLKAGVVATAGIALSGCSESTDSSADGGEEGSESESDSSGEPDTESAEPEEVEPTEPDEPPALEHLHGISADLRPPDDGGYHDLRYEWEALGDSWYLELQIPKALGEYYENRSGTSAEFDQYLADTYDRDTVGVIVEEFTSFKERYELTKPEVVNLAVGFVQGLRYTEDSVTSSYDQYSNYPVETLINQGGDCEDTAILMAVLLRELGYGSALLELPANSPDHMAIGVLGDSSINGTYYEVDSDRYYYLETTGENWEVGEIPDEYSDANAAISEVGPHASLIYNCETRYDEEVGEIVLESTVWNVGDSTAVSGKFYAEFENRSKTTQEAASHQIGFLEPDNAEDFELRLQPPEGEALRLRTTVTLDGSFHESSVSEYQDPI